MDFAIGVIVGFILCCVVISHEEIKWIKRIYKRAYKDAVEKLKGGGVNE